MVYTHLKLNEVDANYGERSRQVRHSGRSPQRRKMVWGPFWLICRVVSVVST